jgi:hypothetical protein
MVPAAEVGNPLAVDGDLCGHCDYLLIPYARPNVSTNRATVDILPGRTGAIGDQG